MSTPIPGASFRYTGKDLLNDLPPTEIDVLLNAEIRCREIHVALGRMVDRIDVARPVPGGPHAEGFRQTRELQTGSDAADVVEPDADEIDQAVRYQAGPFHRMAKQFAHRDRSAALLPDHFEVAHLLRRQRVLRKKQAVLLQRLHQIDRLDGLDTLVHIVDQLHGPAVYFSDVLEKLECARDIRLVLLISVRGQAKSRA